MLPPYKGAWHAAPGIWVDDLRPGLYIILDCLELTEDQAGVVILPSWEAQFTICGTDVNYVDHSCWG
jgi:hypothetical protein